MEQIMFSQTEISIRNNLSYKTAVNRIAEFETYVGQGKRYPAQAMFRDGRLVRVNEEAFIDFMRNSSWLRDKRAKKHVKPYKAKKYPCIV